MIWSATVMFYYSVLDMLLTSAAIAISERIIAFVAIRCSDGTAITTSDSRGIWPQLLSRLTMAFTCATVPSIHSTRTRKVVSMIEEGPNPTIRHLSCTLLPAYDLSGMKMHACGTWLTVALPVAANELSPSCMWGDTSADIVWPLHCSKFICSRR